jgi:hypothetical protein
MAGGKIVLDEPVEAKVTIHQWAGESDIGTMVDCPHICGPHGECCGASSVNEYKVFCPYSFDFPYCFDMVAEDDERKAKGFPCPTCGKNPRTGRCPNKCDENH